MKRPADLAPHPAEWSDEILAIIAKIIPEGATVLDPMAGTGWRLERALPGRTLFGIELEPEWARGAEWVKSGNAKHLPFLDGIFEWVVTSPTYANRMADAHDAKERCKNCSGLGLVDDGESCPKCKGKGFRDYKRLTYRHRLGRTLHQDSTASLGWLGRKGDKYRADHEEIWAEVWRVLAPGGRFILNVKNHYRTLVKGQPAEEMLVAEWHRDTLLALGFRLDRTIEVPTPGMRFGANREARAEHEYVMVFAKPVDASTTPGKG